MFISIAVVFLYQLSHWYIVNIQQTSVYERITFIFSGSLFITDLNILDKHYVTFIEFVNALSTFPPQTLYSKKTEILISFMFCEVLPLCLFVHITFFT